MASHLPDKKFQNVLLLCFGCVLLFAAFQTTAIIQKTVMESVVVEDPEFAADGYTSLAIVYASFAVTSWFAPSAISVLTPKWTIVVSVVPYLLYIGSFLRPIGWVLYALSALMGVAAALFWTGQGNMLTICSDKDTIVRNSGIFGGVMPVSLLIGNIFVFLEFEGQSLIGPSTRTTVFGVLVAVAGAGLLVFLCLRPFNETWLHVAEDEDADAEAAADEARDGDEDEDPTNSSSSSSDDSGDKEEQKQQRMIKPDSGAADPEKFSPVLQLAPVAAEAKQQQQEKAEAKQHHHGSRKTRRPNAKRGPKHALVASVRLLLYDRDMTLLCGTFVFMGLHLSFYSGVYSAAIGFTRNFGEDTARYVGISGMLLGAGGTAGGLLVTLLGRRVTDRGRCALIVLGGLPVILACALIVINLPDNAVFGPSFDDALIESSISLALFCSLALGFGDALFQSQVYALLGSKYAGRSAPAFALFRFVMMLAAAAAFFYSSHLGLRGQLGILAASCVVGIVTFCMAVRRMRR